MVSKSSLVLSAIAALGFMAPGYAQLVVPNSNSLVANIDMNGIKAQFLFIPVTKGTGAEVHIDVTSGLSKSFVTPPAKGFEYHIHVNPVGPNNDCMATGGHLDPTNVGAAKCNPTTPEKCQEGDLSGKHGELKASESGAHKISYVDRQLQLKGETTTIAGRSIVIHNNGARVACGNIVPYGSTASSEGESVDSSKGNSKSTQLVQSEASDSTRVSVRHGTSALVAILSGWLLSTIV
ncbi:hypothetical protein BGZ94_002019 [Podila epigama]|nr:hypothetical protein BGZ94_002019 [Podila epigama]